MANVNIQMIYWHTFSGNLIGLNHDFIDYYYDLMDDFKQNARKIFGMEGIYVSAGSTPGFGLANQIVPVITNWIGGAGWISQLMYKYYLYTGDKETLIEKILPFMYEAALFYENYLVLDGDTYRVYPSVSPENTPGNLMPEKFDYMSHPCPTAINATMDLAIIKELFSNIIVAAFGTEKYQEKIAVWEGILRKMPAYAFNEDGSVKEWMQDDLEDYDFHRHISHAYVLFPGAENNQEVDENLLQAFQKSVHKRILGGQTGWSLCLMASIYARLGESENAIESIETLTRSCLTNSFFTMHNDFRKMGLTLDLDEFAPVQLDANLGLVNAIQDMLFFANDSVSLLPACPKRFRKGRAAGFRSKDAVLSYSWDLDEKDLHAEIRAIRETTFMLKLPTVYTKARVEREQHSQEVELRNGCSPAIELKCNETVIIDCRG